MLKHTDKSPAYDPLHKMSMMDAKHITIGNKVVGVGTTHVAQNLLGFKQKGRPLGINHLDENGEVVLFRKNWAGGCGNGFPNFFPLYEKGGAILARGKIGQANAMVTSMKATLDIELDKLSQDPTFFFCGERSCVSCNLTWEFSKGNRFVVYSCRALDKLRSYLFR